MAAPIRSALARLRRGDSPLIVPLFRRRKWDRFDRSDRKSNLSRFLVPGIFVGKEKGIFVNSNSR